MALVEKARTAAQARLEAVKALPAAYVNETLRKDKDRNIYLVIAWLR